MCKYWHTSLTQVFNSLWICFSDEDWCYVGKGSMSVEQKQLNNENWLKPTEQKVNWSEVNWTNSQLIRNQLNNKSIEQWLLPKKLLEQVHIEHQLSEQLIQLNNKLIDQWLTELEPSEH